MAKKPLQAAQSGRSRTAGGSRLVLEFRREEWKGKLEVEVGRGQAVLSRRRSGRRTVLLVSSAALALLIALLVHTGAIAAEDVDGYIRLIIDLIAKRL